MFVIDKNLMPTPATFATNLGGLVAWLETQDAAKTYCWAEAGDCLFHKFGKAAGFGSDATSYDNTIDAFRRSDPHADQNGEPYNIAIKRPHTFGAALERAREIQAAHLTHPHS